MRTPLVAVLCALVGGAAGAGLVLALDDDEEKTTVVREPALTRAPARGDAEGLSAVDIYKRDAPGVGFIVAEVVEEQQTSPFLAPEVRRGQSTGTGFLIDDKGSVLTNAHVVEGAQRVVIRFGEDEVLDAKVKGRDRSSDLALLEVDPEKVNAKPLALGTSADVEVGDPTVAIGNPFGLDRTLTTGVISAKQRQIDAPNGFTIRDVLQTDAAINPGNSGGPLIDAEGKVIGVNSAIRAAGGGGNVGIGFAVPIDTAKRILPELREKGRVDRAYLGVTTGTVDPTMNLRVERGAFVEEIVPGGPADDRDGLRPADIIVRIDGKPVESSEDVSAIVDTKKPGDRVKIEVIREGDEESVEVELGKRPEQLAGG